MVSRKKNKTSPIPQSIHLSCKAKSLKAKLIVSKAAR